MDKNEISLREVANDGQSIFLYYDAMAGVYLAYGLSAYYTTMVTEPYMSYSEELQMPVALLRQSLKKVEHEMRKYYQFQLRMPVGEGGYDRWARNILNKHLSVKPR